MNMFCYCFSVASVTIGLESPWPFKIEARFKPFVIPWQKPDVMYRFLPTENGKKIPNFLVCRQSQELYHIYYHEEDVNELEKEGKFSSFLAWEENFLDRQAFYLHSSCVTVHNHGIIFTAPSGTGKSTQADLWVKYRDADILNGDRTIVRREEEGWRCYGSPYAGSSQIYKNESTALSAIFVLAQGSENTITRLSPGEAFVCLYRETVQNPWNRDYVEAMSALLEQAVLEIPIYRLTCRPDREAVELVYQTVFPKKGE